ncbi:MAG: NADPH-dependent F420 reductase [Chloroflexota bacterium]
MKIGIVGSGRMGSGLGTLWSTRRKHQVFFGSRKRMKSEALAQVAGPGSGAGIYEEAAEYGEVVVIALPWQVTEATITRLAPYLSGKTIIDVTNPLTPQQDGLAIDGNTSGAQIIQSLVPDAHVVKAFNGIYFDMLDKPMLNGQKLEIYYCGDNDDAKAHTKELIEDLGFVAADLGGLNMARYLETMVFIWIRRLQQGAIPPHSVINIFKQR